MELAEAPHLGDVAELLLLGFGEVRVSHFRKSSWKSFSFEGINRSASLPGLERCLKTTYQTLLLSSHSLGNTHANALHLWLPQDAPTDTLSLSLSLFLYETSVHTHTRRVFFCLDNSEGRNRFYKNAVTGVSQHRRKKSNAKNIKPLLCAMNIIRSWFSLLNSSDI